MVVYDVGRHKMGNTTISTVAVWPVCIKAVDSTNRTVVASWNHNQERTYREHQFRKWRLKKPELIKQGFCSYRLATKKDKEAMK